MLKKSLFALAIASVVAFFARKVIVHQAENA